MVVIVFKQRLILRRKVYGQLGAWLVIWLLLVGCSYLIDPDRGVGPDGQPRILQMRLPGISDQNIQIDQDTRQLIVTVPTNLSANAITPQFQLTPDTRVISKYTDSLRVYPLAKNDSVRIITDRQKTNAYRIVFKPAGELAFVSLSAPLAFTVNPATSYLCLPLFNFIDGEPSGTLELTNLQTGRTVYTLPQYPSAESYCDRSKRTDGAVVTYAVLNGQMYYEPGDYRVDFVKPNNRRTQLNQSIRLVRGAMKIYFDADYPVVVGETGATVFAANVFATDKISLLFRSRRQGAVSITPTEMLTKQPGFKLPAIPTLQPGYYYAQLLVDGQPTDAYVRIPVVSSSRELVIQKLYGYNWEETDLLDPAQSFDTPVKLQREKDYGINTNAYTAYLYTLKPGDSAARRVHLQSLTNPSVSYLVPLTPDGPAQFRLPATIQSGRYRFTFEIKTVTDVVLSSQPLERDVLVE